MEAKIFNVVPASDKANTEPVFMFSVTFLPCGKTKTLLAPETK